MYNLDLRRDRRGESVDLDERRVDGSYSSIVGPCGLWQYLGQRDCRPRISLYLAERHLVIHLLGLLLILTVAALALRATRILDGAPTAAVGAHRLSSKRQGGYHRRSGRFVVKNPLEFAHYTSVQFWDKLKKITYSPLLFFSFFLIYFRSLISFTLKIIMYDILNNIPNYGLIAVLNKGN